MFKHLDKGQTTKVKDAMFLVDKNPGDVIIKEGYYHTFITTMCIACLLLYSSMCFKTKAL
jgi:hypothetical protein